MADDAIRLGLLRYVTGVETYASLQEFSPLHTGGTATFLVRDLD